MDFIERWLGVSPDGGNGGFELVIVACLAATVLGLVYRWRVRAAARRRVGPWGEARPNPDEASSSDADRDR
jgi:hypothetical protein